MNPQFLMDGLIAGAIIGLGAVGVTLTYSILRFSNFAHGELLSWGAYLALGISSALGVVGAGFTTPLGPFSFGWSLPIAAVLAIVLTGLLALAVDAALFSSFRRRGSAIIIMVMASFGASLALRSLLEFLFTSKPAYFSQALHLVMTRTDIGRAMRAVSENPGLAGIAGIDVRRVIRTAWFLGAALACIAGIMSGLIIQIRPYLGHDLLLPLFAAAILGGIGSVPGAMIAGLFIGLSEAFTVQLSGAELRAAVSFAILIACLLVRPRGLFGKAT